ncbi:MAG: hypothetical protein ACK5MP_01185 [Nostocoides sp.]
MDIERQLMNPDGSVEKPWAFAGYTCVPDAVPGAAGGPGMARIIQAFHHTRFATASVGFQPKGNLTVVNFPNYYAARFTPAGYGPGEVDVIDPKDMLGYTVQIRPNVLSYTYHYGDGEQSDPTTSPGGTYPTGDIIHTYTKTGTYRAYVSITWGADYQINTGPWHTIPDHVTITQPATTITVAQAHAHLIP